ncbi:hypothetical protein GIB67_041739 [Kingdonia uniflora]|uniref:Uncharacterized protein n=1 Tax=Kingdonia uniflora TaxID=39325 RepID=A0A7J7NNT7_9MAGN|nr:hypothetical protein GIB67_041739 [Kingdonia uniflora]
MSLGKTLGTPIQIDHSSSTMDFGYFAKVLVDIHLAVPFLNKILVEVDEGDFWQRVELGSTPKFCSHCKITGHTFVEYRAIKEQVLRAEEPKEKQKNQKVPAPEEKLYKELEETTTENEEKRGFNPEDGEDIADTSRPGHDRESPHQLHKETAPIRLQSALKWADMVDDAERDNALITYEGVWPTPGIEKEPKKLTAKKKFTGISVGKSYPNTRSSNKKNWLGNLWCLWKIGLQDPLLMMGSPQQITTTYDGILIAAIHGMVTSSARRALWVDMANIAALNLPWLAFGDFNCICNWDERSGGTGPLPCSISEFNDCIYSCRLIKSFSTGPKFSWYNGQKGKARILRRLDSVLYNSAWIQKFDGWSSKYMTRENSDHSAMVRCIQDLSKPHNIPFRFLKGWVIIITFEDMVIQSWGERLTSDPIFVLMKKLQRLKNVIKIWRKDNMGGLQTKPPQSKPLSTAFSILKIQSGGRKPKLPGLLVGSVIKDKQKFVTINWNKVCNHPCEGGIGIHGLRHINLSMLMKLGWGFLNVQDPWATFHRAKIFTRGGLLINYNQHSSIWNGLKEVITAVQANSKWIIGSGRDINFWRDCWGSEVALINLLNIQPEIWKHCTSKLSQIIF